MWESRTEVDTAGLGQVAPDAARIGEMIRPGSLAGVVLYENVWLTAIAEHPEERSRD
jgi:hypothetical protein